MKRLTNRKMLVIFVALGLLSVRLFQGEDVTSAIVSIIVSVIGL